MAEIGKEESNPSGLQLLFAIREKDKQTISKLLNEGVDPNYSTSNLIDGKSSALYAAVKSNDPTIVRCLLEVGANANIEDEEGDTPLFSAVGSDSDPEIRALLVKYRANRNHRNKSGKSILFDMIENKEMWGWEISHDAFFEFLEACDDLGQENTSGQGLIHLLQYIHTLRGQTKYTHSCVQCIQFLIERGVSVNQVDPLGRTAIHSLASAVCFDGMLNLIEKGANAALRDIKGQTPLHSLTPLSDSFEKCLDLLLHNGCRINDIDSYGRTLIYNVCSSSSASESAIKQLLVRQASVFVRDKNGLNSLHACVLPEIHVPHAEPEDKYPNKPNASRVMTLLVQSGVSVNSPNKEGLTPLHFAVRQENVEVVQTLLDLGSDVNLRTKTGETVLHRSTINSNIFNIVFDSFLKSDHDSAAINGQDNFGSTPLHWAVWYSEPDIVKILLDNKANMDMQDKAGFSPRDLAFFLNQASVYEHLGILYHRGFYPLGQSSDESSTSDSHLDVMCSDEMEPLGSDESIQECQDADLLLPDCPLLGTIYNEGGQVNLLSWFLHLQEHATSLHNFVNFILSSKKMGLYYETDDNASIEKAVHRVMKETAKRVANINPLMECDVQLSGSWDEGTKICTPSEFDFKWILKHFAEAFSTEETYEYPTGYVRFRLREGYHDKFQKYVDHDNYLDGRKVIRELYFLINEVIPASIDELTESLYPRKNLKIDRGSISNLSFRWVGFLYKDLLIDVDVVPCIQQKDWKPTSVDWRKNLIERYSIVPTVGIVMKTPDPRFVKNWNTYFRISVAELEANIIQKIPTPIKKGFILLKALKDTLYMPQVFDKDYAQDYVVNEITTYKLKTCFLHELENAEPVFDHSAHYISAEDNDLTIDWAFKILNKLKDCLEKSELPSYFFPTTNLLVNNSMNRFNEKQIFEAEAFALAHLLEVGSKRCSTINDILNKTQNNEMDT